MYWNPKNPVVPFNEAGDMLHYPTNNALWYPWISMHSTLTLDGMRRGQSSATYWWIDEFNRRFPMMLADTYDLMNHGTINNGKATARWGVRKRGMNYGITAIKPL